MSKLPELIPWGQAHRLLHIDHGFSWHEATRALRDHIADVKHGLHSRKRWRRKDVIAFARSLTEDVPGKGGDVPHV